MSKAKISIVMPVLNEAESLKDALQALQVYREAGHELILVDGGSTDGTLAICLQYSDRLIRTVAGRAVQMNEGVHHAKFDTILFLHSDTRLPALADELIINALSAPEHVWGRFNLRFSGKAYIFRLIATCINWRSYLSGIATGDQAIFVSRDMFEKVRRFDLIPLMEDVALSKKLLKYARPHCLKESVLSSSRRWEKEGIINTILLMWGLRLAYYLGISPNTLVSYYYKAKRTPTKVFEKV